MQDRTPEPKQLDPIERATLDELRAVQLKRLQWSLHHAYENVDHYRASFTAAGVHPDDCKDLTDLAKFPFTAKQDLRDNYPFGMFAVPREQVSRVHASSGTTGRPTVVGYTKDDVATWAALMARSIRAAGGRPGDVVHVAYGYGLFTGGLGAHYGAEALGCTVVPVSGGMTERQVRLIRDFEPDVIMVTPSYMLAIVDELERQGVDPKSSSLAVGIFGAEPWTNDMRVELEQRLDMHAVDIYGLSEVMGPGVAQECVETKDGLHVWEDHFYPEIVDPRSGDVLAEGERARLHVADEGGAARHPLPDARPDAAATGDCTVDAPHGEDHRPQRRHDHPARRQSLPHADRGADPLHVRPLAALPARALPAGPPGRADRPRGGPPQRGRGRAAQPRRARAGQAREGEH